MNVIWHKIWYDLWQNKLRTLLVILSIAVGVFAVGTTFGMVDQMLPTMDEAHRLTKPSHVTLFTTRPVDLDIILALRRTPGVEDVEGYNVVEVRYKIQPNDPWRRGNILMRNDYENQHYDILQLKKGSWPEGRSLGIERMHSPWYGIGVGDQVIMEVDGQERVFHVTGLIRHPFVPPPSMYDLAWFFGGEEVMEMFGIPRGQFIQIKFRVTPYSEKYAKEIASDVKERLAKQGIGVSSTLYQDPDKHWGRAFIDGMSLVTQVLAVLSMLLSVVLVMNTLTALITQQTNQIGIMKAVGGTSFTVIQVYLAGVFFYGLLSLCVALPLGSLASFRITQWFLGLYNIEYEQFNFSNRAATFQILAALIVPLVAALAPILNGSLITVRQAISSYGLGGDFGASWIDRFVERVARRFLVSYYTMSLTNTFRRKGRLALTQLVLVIAGVMFLVVLSLSSSIKATLDAEFGRRQYDLIVYFTEMQRVDRITKLMDNLPGIEECGMWLVAPATIHHQGQRTLDAGLGSQLQGVSVDDPMYVPKIVEGRWLQTGDHRVVVINKQTADDNGIKVGDWITLDLGDLGKADWQVAGLYRVFLMFGGGFNVDAIYAPRSSVFEVTKKNGRANTLFVRTNDHSDEATKRMANDLEDMLQNQHLEISQIETMPNLRKTSDTSFSYVIGMLLVLACIVALVGGIGLMGSLWISVIERTKEIGILRAVGAVSPIIIRMFMLEGVIQGLMSWMIAIPISILVAPALANALGQTMFKSGLDYAYNIQAVFVWLGIILVISALASFIPARSAAQVNVRQSLNYE
jgi:putative ABC transport system permease protein